MINKLYIKNIIKNNITVYINIILIITVSIIIINILNIFLDSVIYGSNLIGTEISKGYNIWIENSVEDNLSYFNNIPNIEIKYEDKIIYIKILNAYEEEKIQNSIFNIISENNLELTVKNFSHQINGKAIPYEWILFFNILKIFFMIIGTISIYFIYLLHIENKKKDLGILISLGMNEKQLKKLLLFELFIIFVFSFIIALITSNILMYYLIQKYLFTENRNFIPIIYKFSVPSTILLLFISVLSLITAFFITTQKIINIPVINSIQQNFINVNIKRNTKIWNKSSSIKYIAKANLTRNKKQFFICSIISILAICIITVLFNLTNLLNTPHEEADFSIGNNYFDVYNNSNIILENIEILKKVTGIKSINYIVYFNDFLLKKNEAKLSFPTDNTHIEHGSVEYHHISIRVLTDEQLETYKKDNINNNIDNYKAENHIILSKNITYSKYDIGDEIFIYDNHEPLKSLTIAGFIDVPQNGNFLNIYVTEENFERIVGKPAIPNEIKIYVDDDANISIIRNNINNIFKDKNLFDIMDYIKIRQDRDVLYKGILIIVKFLCSVLFLCAIVLLWAFINFYITNQKLQNDILKLLGTTKKVIWSITIYEAFIKGIINSLVGLIIGTCVSYFVILMSIYDLVINRYLFITYGLIIIITIMAHIVPSFITIRKITAENVKIKENE